MRLLTSGTNLVDSATHLLIRLISEKYSVTACKRILHRCCIVEMTVLCLVQQILTFLDEIFKVPAPSEPEAAQSSTPLGAKLSIESMAQAEKARVAAILADQAKAEAAQDSQGPGLVLRESPQKSSAEASEAQVDQPGPEASSEVAAEAEHAAEASGGKPLTTPPLLNLRVSIEAGLPCCLVEVQKCARQCKYCSIDLHQRMEASSATQRESFFSTACSISA